jgi:XTP/dITP diphosphohydrolase
MPHNSAPAAASAARRSRGPTAPALLVVASANAGKLREFSALLADLPFEVVSQASLGVVSPEETGASFLENALLKARHAAAATGAAVIADDSGLEVDALGGAPGIYSARYAGPDADDAANNAKLLMQMRGVPPELRRARYRCVLVFLPATTGEPTVAEGVWEGRIATEGKGRGGFGYDPYFWLPELRCTAAELDADHKNRLSHRGQAMRQLQHALRERCGRGGASKPPR